MAGNGPAPTPTNILKMRGSWRANRRRSEPISRGKPVCPRWLTPGAKSCWKRLAPKLNRLGILSESDGDALSRYCVTRDQWEQMSKSLGGAMEPETWKAHVMLAKLAEQLGRLEQQFGMTPSARTRVNVKAPDSKNGDSDKSKYFKAASRSI